MARAEPPAAPEPAFRSGRAVRARRGLSPAFVHVVFFVIAAHVPACGSAAQHEPVAVELVLAVDTSISVSPGEYHLQMSGIANAFRTPEIIDIIARQPGGVAVTLVHWSVGSLNHQAVGWHHLRDTADTLAFAARVRDAPRVRTGRGTAIADAIDYSARLIETNAFRGTVRKIDISGDARSNSGPSPHFARDRAVAAGLTINGLVIPGGDRELVSYYRLLVIGGRDSFVMTADSRTDFANAMQRKISRELNLIVSSNTATAE